MENEIDKNVALIAQLFDYLNNSGYFSNHNQLIYYDGFVSRYYQENNKEKLKEIYDDLKKQTTPIIMSYIEKSAGIRYFCCDSCHDATANNISLINNLLDLELDTANMLGSLNNNYDKCNIQLHLTNNNDATQILIDCKNYKKFCWLDSQLSFDESNLYFNLQLQPYNSSSTFSYKFQISDISIII